MSLLKTLFKRAEDHLLARLLDADADIPDDPPPPVDEVVDGEVIDAEFEDVAMARMRAELELMTRKASDYFGIIEGIERERNEWKEMYYSQSRMHMTAQEMLLETIRKRNQQIVSVLAELNMFRLKRGIPAVKDPSDLKAPPLKTAEEFRAYCDELEANKDDDIDGIAERDAATDRFESCADPEREAG